MVAVAITLFVCLACGDTTAPATTQMSAGPAVTADAAQTPTPAAPAQTVVTFLNAPITAARGLNATIQVRTAPNTSCSIEVDYKSGPSTAAGLGAKTSDGAGNMSWTWKVSVVTGMSIAARRNVTSAC